MGSETTRGWHEDHALETLQYGVRWSGFVSPSVAGVYSFMVNFFNEGNYADDRVKVWIDNTLVIQQWTSLRGDGIVSNLVGGGSQYERALQGTFFFSRAHPEPFPISIAYKNIISASASGLKLSWQSLILGNENTTVPVPSTRLFPLSGRHQVAYTATTSGDYEVLVSAAQGHGLDATFYSDTDLLNPIRSDERKT